MSDDLYMTLGPHEMPFVLDVSDSGTVTEHAGFDVYRPKDAEGPLPAAIIVPGPVPELVPFRPYRWPLFAGYGRLMASRGVVGVVLNLPYHNVTDAVRVSETMAGVVESVRGLDEVDGDRVALWGVSGGALVLGTWFAESPPWLRCLAMTYPLLGAPTERLRPGRPLVVTRVGQEQPDMQAEVDRFLSHAVANGVAVQVIDVPNGHHGFDIADHTDESRKAVRQAEELVVGYLTR
jgi:dienelactone hydrolase